MSVSRRCKIIELAIGAVYQVFIHILEKVTDQASTGMTDVLCSQLEDNEVLISHNTLDSWDVQLTQCMGLRCAKSWVSFA